MAREEVTEYEPVEDAVTRIKCGSCDETWDNRSDDCCNVVALDCRFVRQRRMTGSSDREYSFGRTKHTTGSYALRAEECEDYCDSCLEGLFGAPLYVEIEEPEYYVDEETRTIYKCDFCGEEMGEDPHHEISVNPAIVIVERKRVYAASNAPSVRPGECLEEKYVATRDIDDEIYRGNSNLSITATRDDVYECCDECALSVFGDRSLSNRLYRSVTGFCISVKETLTLQDSVHRKI